METGREEGGCEGGGVGGKGQIIVIIIVIDGNINSNGGHLWPRTAMRMLLLGEDGSGDGS